MRVVGIVAALICSLFMTKDGIASTVACAAKDICRAYNERVVIVVGTVTRVQVVKDPSGKAWYEVAHLRVRETFKGPHENELQIFNRILDYPENPTSDFDLDDANLEIGKTYLIYGAQQSMVGSRLPGVLYVNLCDGVKDELLSKTRISTLREYLKRGTPSEGVYEGYVVYTQESEAKDLPVRGATVRITGENFAVEQVADRNGGFRFFDLRPDEYKVSVITRGGRLLHDNEPFTLSESTTTENSFLACGANKFTTAATGRIDGTIDLPENLTASTVLRSEYGDFRTDANFVYEELPPASYKLLVSSVYSEHKRLVYAHRPLITTINLKSGQKIEDVEYKFTPPTMHGRSTHVSVEGVPERCQEATFELTVTYQDGVTTTFEYSSQQQLIFEKGNGSVHAKARCYPNSSREVLVSQTVKIDPTQPPAELRLWFQ
jgi:hypothetical protein